MERAGEERALADALGRVRRRRRARHAGGGRRAGGRRACAGAQAHARQPRLPACAGAGPARDRVSVRHRRQLLNRCSTRPPDERARWLAGSRRARGACSSRRARRTRRSVTTRPTSACTGCTGSRRTCPTTAARARGRLRAVGGRAVAAVPRLPRPAAEAIRSGCSSPPAGDRGRAGRRVISSSPTRRSRCSGRGRSATGGEPAADSAMAPTPSEFVQRVPSANQGNPLLLSELGAR